MRMMATDFEDTTAATRLWPRFYSTDGNVVIRAGFVAGGMEFEMGQQGYAEATANRFYDLRDSAFSVAVAGTPLPVDGEIALELATPDDQFRLRMLRRGNELIAQRIENNQDLEVAKVAYDETAHAVWQISRVGDDSIWSAGATGGEPTELARFPLPWATHLMPRLYGRREGGLDTFTIRFDDINAGVPAGIACGAFDLADDFEDGTLAEQWRALPGIMETGGTVTLVVEPTGGLASNALVPITFYDLREDEVSFELVTPAPGLMLLFGVGTFDGGQARFQLDNGVLDAFAGGAKIGTATFDHAIHRWWRMRESAGTLFLETSPDGGTFTQFGTTNTVPGLDRADIQIVAQGVIASPLTTTFDNFNNLP
jgi:hypothetical protein